MATQKADWEMDEWHDHPAGVVSAMGAAPVITLGAKGPATQAVLAAAAAQPAGSDAQKRLLAAMDFSAAPPVKEGWLVKLARFIEHPIKTIQGAKKPAGPNSTMHGIPAGAAATALKSSKTSWYEEQFDNMDWGK